LFSTGRHPAGKHHHQHRRDHTLAVPGRRHGQPISPDWLSERLKKIGIRSGRDRSTALFTLAAEIPAAILARTLGIYIQVAVAWQCASAGDWMTYAADVSRRTQLSATETRNGT
jgi:hypothetical protein